MKNHRYKLEKYHGPGSRHTCPGCKESRVLTLYMDSETGLTVHPSVGRCNRESNCGYHYTPKGFFQDNNISIDTNPFGQIKRVQLTQRPTSYIPFEKMKESLRGYQQNNFVKYLISFFGEEVTAGLVKKYFIGTSKHWPGSTIFWQVDTKGKVRSGKIMLFNLEKGKRVKKPFDHITWVHSVLKLSEFELKQALFGEHLLEDISKPIGLVEGEKTAIIASVYLPKFIWLATGGLSNLPDEKCRVLSGRTVVLFPDVKGFEKWNKRMKHLSELMPGTRFEISDLLEKNATVLERKEGCDIADYLIKFPWKSLSEQERILQLFMKKNPLLSKLTEVFDLASYQLKDSNTPKSSI